MSILDCPMGSVFSISRKMCFAIELVPKNDRVKYFSEILQQTTSTEILTVTTTQDTSQALIGEKVRCPISLSGNYPYPFDGAKYLYCAAGKLTIEDCGPGSAYSLSKKRCQYKEDIASNDRVKFVAEYLEHWIISVYTSYFGQNIEFLGCPPKINGTFLHPFDCTKYIECRNGMTIVDNCIANMVFSISRTECVPNGQVDAFDRVDYFTDTQHEFSQEFRQTSNANYKPSATAEDLNREGHNLNVGVNNQYGQQGSGYGHNSWATQNHDHSGSVSSSQTTVHSPTNGYQDRWSNMNRERPPVRDYNNNRSPSWTGIGSSVENQTPTRNILFEEGSLQPDRNYVHTIKSYSAPLAPFSSTSPISAVHTNTHVYYAQPLGSQEDSREAFRAYPSTELRPPTSSTSTHLRQNFSREFNNEKSLSSWQPTQSRDIYDEHNHKIQTISIPNRNLMPPLPDRPTTHDGNVYLPSEPFRTSETSITPNLHLMAPHREQPSTSESFQKPEPEYGLAENQPSSVHHNLYQGGRVNQPSTSFDASNLYGGMQPPLPDTTTPIYSANHRLTYASPIRDTYIQSTTPVADESNLFGGLQPPINAPITVTAQRAHDSYVPQTDTQSHSKARTTVNVYQIYPTVVNATVRKTSSDPHYSSPYSAVAHSRNSTWIKTAHAPYSQDSSISTTTQHHGVSPPDYDRHYEETTQPSRFNSEFHGQTNLNVDEPLNDALRMLLRPYIDRTGAKDNQLDSNAESHIMNLVAKAATTSTTTERSYTTNRKYPLNIGGSRHSHEDDYELLQAGEQKNLLEASSGWDSGQHQLITEYHGQQRNSVTPNSIAEENHKHSKEFHLKHPHLRNPFTSTETSRSIAHTHKHRHHHHRHNHQHSREFHQKHPHLPNPFASTVDDNTKDASANDNPYTEQTGPNIDLRTFKNEDDSSTVAKCEFSCGNSKCVKQLEVCDGINNCGNRKDESECDHLGYQIRLADGESSNSGRIEVKIMNQWGYVCDDKFGLRDADVACRELGFNLGASEVRGNSFYAPKIGNVTFAMDEVDCLGNETSLKECVFNGWGVNNCGPDEIVGVVCKVPLFKCPNNYWLCSTSKECIPPAFVCDNTPDCADKSDESDKTCNSSIEYRLDGGRTPNEGRLEVMYRGEWGSVCDDDFGLTEAQVACNSLGFYGVPEIKKNIFGPSNGPIWLDQVSCLGNETSVDQCSHWTWGEHNCNHTEDVGLKCVAGPPPRKSTTRLSAGKKNNDDEAQSMLEDIGIDTRQWARSSKVLVTERRCGKFKSDVVDEYEHPEERVVNGTIAKRGRHPWQATIRTRGRGGISSHWCGAVLISRKHLLTAAHCLSGYPKGAYFIRMGDHYANIAESSEIDSYIENWYIHEKFRDKTHMNNDIALVVLKNPVRFNDYVQPICLPEKGTEVQENRLCTISGWGSIKSGVSTPSNILRAAQIPLLSDATCKQSHVYGMSMTDGMFCAGFMDESVDACDGDSGGPLVCSDEGVETLYGIISWGQHCGYINKPGVYVRVEKYIDWIYEKINYSMQQSQN